MKASKISHCFLFAVTTLCWPMSAATSVAELKKNSPTKAIPWSELGATAGAQYSGDGLGVTPTEQGARLRCVFQRMDGEATSEGLWLISTVTGQPNDRFRVVTAAVGGQPLSRRGEIFVTGQAVKFRRPGLVEEYSVSMNGVRQDFVVLEKPVVAPNPPTVLRVELSVSGAAVEQTDHGAQLILCESGRRVAYSRLKVTDAHGRELSAHFEVAPSRKSAAQIDEEDGGSLPARLSAGLAIVVDDTDALYPIRIDPTFSDENWISMSGFPGASGAVRSAVMDGAGNLYIGGDFTEVGDVIASRIAKWDGSSWSALGAGMNDTVSALAVLGGDLYAGGFFTTAGGVTVNQIAKWNGSNWSALGSGVNSFVQALGVSGGDLYAGGGFTMATNSGGAAVTVNRIAKWNGSNWSALGAGVNDIVYALAVSGGNVYAGGVFTTATNTSGTGLLVNRIARWNGTAWSTLGSGINNTVRALAVSGSDLYAGGEFTGAVNSGGVPVTVARITKWNGSSWSALGSGINNTVYALAVSGSNVYAGGLFSMAGGGSASYIARWNGSSWSALGSGMNVSVSALAAAGSNLYAGGNFSTAGGVPAKCIAQWDGSSWSALGSGVNYDVTALAVAGSNVYAGGLFTWAGDASANYIAKWDGSNWNALGSGMSGGANLAVNALAVSGSNLFAGGWFTTAGGVPANRIARWDGSSWNALGSGLDERVYALATLDNNLYVGGAFTTATNSGGAAVTVNRIARWNGTSWSALGSGMNGQVTALAVSGGDLYVGGAFTTATNSGGVAVTVNRIAKWNGSSWSALGSGMNGQVSALAATGGDLYAGGVFTRATNSGGVAVTVIQIARWNGSSWSALGLGMSSQVSALAWSSGDLYAAGAFTRATNSGGVAVTVNGTARWDGSSWNALGAGVNGTVWALTVTDGDLFAGGSFTKAGGKVSAYVARAELNIGPPGYNQITPQLLSGGQMRLSYIGLVGNAYALDRTFSLSSPATWNPQATNVAAPDGLLVFTNTPVSTTNNFWRIRSVP